MQHNIQEEYRVKSFAEWILPEVSIETALKSLWSDKLDQRKNRYHATDSNDDITKKATNLFQASPHIKINAIHSSEKCQVEDNKVK